MKLSQWFKRSPAPTAPTVPLPASSPTFATDSLLRGNALLEAGRLLEAAEAFRQAIALTPERAALHVNLAYALQQTEGDAAAVPHLRRAVMLDEANFDARYMLGSALEAQGDPAGAVEQLRRALELQPGFEPARAQLCRVLVAAGDPAAARIEADRAVALNPGNADFHHYLGNLQLGDGDHDGAIASFKKALALKPDYAEVHANLGLAWHTCADYDAAAASYERSIALAPDAVATWLKLATTRKAQGRLEEATDLLRRALEIDPEHAEALNQLGIVLQEQGLLERAIASYRRAIELAPDQPGAYGNLGLALYELGRMEEAIANYRRGLAVKPLATTHDNLGIALHRQGAIDEAIEQYHLALALDPENLNTRCNLAGALADGQGTRESLEHLRAILAIKPDHVVAHSNLLFSLAYDLECPPEAYLAEARRHDAMLTKSVLPSREARPEGGVVRPLRVGFVSGDLRSHPVGFFFEGIVEHLDPDRLALYAYSTSPQEDTLTARLRRRFAGWRFFGGNRDQVIAEAVQADGIDVLIDLAGHSALNGLSVFAWRPAPVQVSWLGYFASTGLSAMDYVLADPVSVPLGHESQFTERIWRMPHTRLCYTPPGDEVPEVGVLPALANGHITFGCFQRLPKINDTVLALWGRVFEAMPTARLLLRSYQLARPRYVDALMERLAKVGIEESRVTLRPPASREAYMASYAEVDVMLDTFPFTGGTTTCEALWMGVPTLTLAGDTMLSLQGAALLAAAGLPDWVAADADEYVRKAQQLTAEPVGLATLRAGLREQVRRSPLFDTKQFARDLEVALFGMWQARASETAAESSGVASG